MMALAIMHRKGSFADRLDQSLQGNVEDRRQNPDAEEAQTIAARRLRTATERPAAQMMKQFDEMKLRRSAER